MNNTQSVSTNTRKEDASALKGCICDLLKWTDQEYAEYQYNNGIEFLDHYIPDDPTAADQLIRSRIYWAWWRNQWMLRDAVYINATHIHRLCPLVESYKVMHDPRDLASSLYIGRVILEQSYAEMIGRLFDSSLKRVV